MRAGKGLIAAGGGFTGEKEKQHSTAISDNSNDQRGSLNEAQIKFVPFPDEFKKYNIYPWEILKLSEFGKTYRALVGSRTSKWLQKLDGPSSKNKMIDTNQGKFVVIHSCKRHYCDTDLLLVLFNPISGKMWGLLREGAKETWLGNPEPDIKNLLKNTAKVTWPNLHIVNR